MTTDPLHINDSEQLLKDKFLLANITAVTGELNNIARELLEFAKSEFRLEVDASFSASDLVDPEKGPELFAVYNKYFTFLNDNYSFEYALKFFVNPSTISIDWIKSKTDYILSTYDSFSFYEFSHSDSILVKKLYIVMSLDQSFSSWNRGALHHLEPSYFTSGRQSRFYKDKPTRKLLSLEPYLTHLSVFDKIVLLNDRVSFYEDELTNDNYWRRTYSFEQGRDALKKIIEDLEASQNS